MAGLLGDIGEGFSNFMGGFGGMSPEQAQSMGLTDADRKYMQQASMRDFGKMLMVLGMPMTSQQRAQAMAGMANNMPDPMERMDRLQQARLRQMQAANLQRQMDMRANLMQMLGIGGTQQAPVQTPNPAGGAAPAPADNKIEVGPVMPIPGAQVAPTGPQDGPQFGPTVVPMGTQPGPMPPNAPQQTMPQVGMPDVLGSMDPRARAMLTLGALDKPEEAAKTIIQQQQWQKELVPMTLTDPQGNTRTIQVQRGQAPALMDAYTKRGWTVGEPKYNKEQETVLEGLGKEYMTLNDAAEGAKELNGRLTRMEANLAGFNPGKGSDQYYNAAAWLNSFLPGEFLPNGMSADKVSNYQEFAKLSTQYATEQARQMGAREAASVVQMLVNANPNAEMTPEALKGIIAGLRAQNDYAIEKAKNANTWRDEKGSLKGFNSYWLESGPKPEKFLLKYLTPEQLQAMPDSVLKQLMGQ